MAPHSRIQCGSSTYFTSRSNQISVFLLAAPVSPVQQKAVKPGQDALSNPFVQAAFSPSKAVSFKSIAKQALLAQIRPVVSPQKDKQGDSPQKKYRSPFTAMLVRRSTLTNKTEATESPVKQFKEAEPPKAATDASYARPLTASFNEQTDQQSQQAVEESKLRDIQLEQPAVSLQQNQDDI